jgi:ABC-type lipoprotein release transport system permease subunit
MILEENQSAQEARLAREEAKRDMKMYLANDWQLKEETPEYFLLKRNEGSTTGHILIFIFFGWWSFGIANFLYYLAKRKTKKIVK